MKRVFIALLLAAALSGCTMQPSPRPTASPAPTPLASPTAQSAIPSATASPSAPAATPDVSSAAAPTNDPNLIQKGMQRDIDLLIERSGGQQIEESNYAGQNKENLITVESVSETELRFAGKPEVFKGDYRGQLTAGQQYKVYEDAAAGGKRAYNVKDNFGVWLIFQYIVPSR